MAIPYNPKQVFKTRYATTFEVMDGYLTHGHLSAPSGTNGTTLYPSTYWKAGTMLSLDTAGYARVAPSGQGQWFALQNVTDMSGLNGYRNLQNTTADRGEMIGCIYGQGMAATAIHGGVGDPGDIGVWDGSTLRFIAPASYVAATMGKAVCILEQADGTDPTKGLKAAGATAGDKDTPSNVKAIIRFSIPLV